MSVSSTEVFFIHIERAGPSQLAKQLGEVALVSQPYSRVTGASTCTDHIDLSAVKERVKFIAEIFGVAA